MSHERTDLQIVAVRDEWSWIDIERLLRERERQGWRHMLDTAIITESPPAESRPKEIVFWRDAETVLSR